MVYSNPMTMLLVILWVVLVAILVLLVAIHPKRSHHSWFELKQRGDEAAMRREQLLGGLIALKRLFELLAVAFVAMLSITIWSGWGVVVAMSVILLGAPIARISMVKQFSQKTYAKYEPTLLDYVEKVSILRRLSDETRFSPHDLKLESTEQLLHLVESSGHVLSEDQQRIIRHGLDWHTTPVEAIMTPRRAIVAIKHSEMLGPLVLDDLHRSGHNRFPVIKGSLDTVIGVLDITEFLEVSADKKSRTAEKSMSSGPLRIESDEPLPNALALLQKSHQHLLIVIDKEGKTVGLVTLADITGSLLGKNRGKVVE
jgi:Mg2+/Co2+ transporter CorB